MSCNLSIVQWLPGILLLLLFRVVLTGVWMIKVQLHLPYHVSKLGFCTWTQSFRQSSLSSWELTSVTIVGNGAWKEKSWNCNFPSKKNSKKLCVFPEVWCVPLLPVIFRMLLSWTHVCAVPGTHSRMKRICSWWSTCCLEGTCATISNKMCGFKRELSNSSSVSWCWPLTTCRAGTSSTGQPGQRLCCGQASSSLMWNDK